MEHEQQYPERHHGGRQPHHSADPVRVHHDQGNNARTFVAVGGLATDEPGRVFTRTYHEDIGGAGKFLFLGG